MPPVDRQTDNVMIKSSKRVLIVGPTGSGKTTLAKALSRVSGLPHIELDLLRYKRDWQELPVDDFRIQVEAVAATDSWIIDGNYAVVRELTWNRADLVVWLDYSLPVILRRLLIRTARRLATARDTGNENREQLRRVLGRRSIVLWAIRSHSPLRKEYEFTITSLQSNVPCIFRFSSPKATKGWLSRINSSARHVDREHKGTPGLSWSAEDCQPEDLC
jgi:adenylate kinase family enzyme